ncbi:MAG: hypothetical protein RSB38_02305, partial [Oscillospiraceae bacterium]
MKRNVRKILAVVATLSMSCAALSVNAATAEITDIKVKTGSNPGTEETVQMGASAGTGFEANASKLVTLKITLKEASALLPNNAATFITYKDGSVYNDSTIQYIDQKTTDTNGIVTITFRPRAALADGNYVLKASGAGVTAPVVGYYKIVNIKEAP